MINAIKKIGELIPEKDFCKNMTPSTTEYESICIVKLFTEKDEYQIEYLDYDIDKAKEFNYIGTFTASNSKKITAIIPIGKNDKLSKLDNLTKMMDDFPEYLEYNDGIYNKEFKRLKKEINAIEKRIKSFSKNNEENFSSAKIKMINEISNLFKKINSNSKEYTYNEKLKYFFKILSLLTQNELSDTTITNESLNQNIFKYKNQIEYKKYLEQFDSLLYNINKIKKHKTLLENAVSEIQSDKTLKKKKMLFTLQVDDIIISKLEGYRNLINYELIEKHFSDNEKGTGIGICSVCGKNNIEISSRLYPLKFYNIDKESNSSNFSEDFSKNFSICKKCLENTYKGKRYIENSLATRIGKDITFYIIPNFFQLGNSKINIDTYTNSIKNLYSPTANIDSLKEYETRLNQFVEFESNGDVFFTLNYLFYYKNKSQFKVMKHINEIVPGRISFINKKLSAINYDFQSYIHGNNLLSLSDIYSLLPISNKIEKNTNIQYYFSLLESVLKTKSINPKMLITKFVESIKIIFYENTESYSLSKKGQSPKLSHYVLKTNIFYNFLREINNINEVSKVEERKTVELLKLLENKILFHEKDKSSDTSDSEESEKNNKGKKIVISNLKKLLNYLKDFQNLINHEQKIALILLGYLMGNVAYKQWKNNLKNKPILKKINFSGLTKKDILRLSNEIYDKLIKYKISDYNEVLLYVKDKIISSNIENWNLSKDENLYYLMSGYSVSQIWLETKEDNNG